MEVFRDPVMTPSGLSYERSALMEHLRKVRAAVHCPSMHADYHQLGTLRIAS